eukprot:5501565-Ditylum_brightwellii.AAC.1
MRQSRYMADPNKPIFDALKLCMAFLYFHSHCPNIYPKKHFKETPMACHFGAEQAEYLTIYKSFFEDYYDADLAHDLRD